MKLNINKDMLLKNRFWVLLGVSVCLILTGIFYLEFSVDADDVIESHRKSLKASGLANKGELQNELTIKAKEDIGAKARRLESEVWRAAYEVQKPLFTWPERFEQEFRFQDGDFANAITMKKLVDPKEWPADSDNLIYGQVLEQQKDWIRLKTRKGEMKIFRTENVANVLIEGAKQIPFDHMAKHPNMMLAVTYQKGRYFNEALTNSQKQVFADTYRTQIDEILRSVDPLDDKGNGVVQLRNWLYRRDALPVVDEKASPMVGYPFFRFVTKEWDPLLNISTEAWIAQENLWIQREIYRIIGEMNQKIGSFTRVGGDNKNKNQENTYRNLNFEVTLSLLADKSLKFTIKNLQPRRQRLDLNFRVQMNNTLDSELVHISGKPLPPVGETGNLHTEVIPAGKATRSGIFKVEQVLSWETAAVRRIDQISIGSNDGADGSHSHRTFPEGLVALDPSATDSGLPPPPAPKFGGLGRPPFGGKGLPAVGAGPGANGGILPHDLWKDRYFVEAPDLKPSEQSRRVPVAMVLIVDQSHVDRILTAFNNSKLRFLDTQVLLNQYSGSLQPPLPADKADPGVGVPIFGPRPRPIGGEGAGPVAPAAGAGGGDLEANMELVIYGIMTLYERYPPRPPGEKKQ